MADLKPCPFCGGEARIHISGKSDGYRVACKNPFACGAKIEWFDKEEEAIEAWNTRKPIEAVVAELEKKANEVPLHTFAYEENDHDGIYNDGLEDGFMKAIEIVRNGGKE